MSTLVTIPIYLREPVDLDVTLRTIETVRETEPAIDILIVDDCSPVQGLVDELGTHLVRLHCDLHRSQENRGFSASVNVGLRRALENGQDGCLINADIECLTPGWDTIMREQLDTQGRPASVVGALLLYPNGLIQHAGVFVSFLTRSFDHRYRFGPGLLPEAQVACCCPCTGAFQWIRHECLFSLGVYPEQYKMGFEDVSFCLRVFESGRECIYQPTVKAVHHESLFRGRADAKLNEWQSDSMQALLAEHAKTNMARFIMEIV